MRWWSSASIPALPNSGFGVVVRRGHRLVAADGGVIATAAGLAPGAPPGRRSTRASASSSTSTEPDAVALEALYFGQNVRTAFAVGQARGVVLLAAGQRGIDCLDYTPQQVKGAVCGTGRADKGQVARMVAALLVAARAAAARPRRRRARRRHLPRQPRAARGGGRGGRVIALVAGEVAVRRPDHVVVETAGGVGYRLAVSAETLRQVPGVGRAGRRCTRTWSCATTRWRSTASPPRRSATSSCCSSACSRWGRRWRSPCSAAGPPRELVGRARGRRRRPPAGRARHRQAHGRADRRRAAREGRRPQRPRRADHRHPRRRPAPHRPRRPARARLRSPPRRRTLLAAAEGETAEELLASALRGAKPLSLERIHTPGALDGEDELDRSLRPRQPRGVRRPGRAARAAAGLHRGGVRARRGARPRPARRPARAWARPRWRRSSPPSSRCPSCRPRARRSSARATSRRC